MSNKWPYVDIMALHPGVTGSCNFVNVKLPNGECVRFIVDIGLFREQEYQHYNSELPFKADQLDFCLITHTHVDHVGRIPFLVKKGFRKHIYASSDTCKLLPLALYDSYKVLRRASRRNNSDCLYNEQDVFMTLNLLKPCKFLDSFWAHDYIKVTFLSNGHLVGAASILVQVCYPGYEDINFLFTGDYKSTNTFFKVDPIPDWVLALPLTVIQESTYGNMNSSDIDVCFEKNIMECVENGGSVIVPVFSLGRSQEILYVLRCMQDNRILNVNVPIYLDGNLTILYTQLYTKGQLNIELTDFLPHNLTFVDKLNRHDVLADTNVKIVLTSSGMGSYGPAQLYIPEYISRENCLIHFTGFAAEDTLSGRLKNTQLGQIVDVGGMSVKKFASVLYTTEFSAHSKADEVIKFLNQFWNLRMVLLNHGEPEIQRCFSERVLNEVNARYVELLNRSYFFRFSTYGLIKSFPTKFV